MALTELDRKYDAVLAAVTGPGGRVILEGRARPGDRRQFPGDPAAVLQDLLRAERRCRGHHLSNSA